MKTTSHHLVIAALLTACVGPPPRLPRNRVRSKCQAPAKLELRGCDATCEAEPAQNECTANNCHRRCDRWYMIDIDICARTRGFTFPDYACLATCMDTSVLCYDNASETCTDTELKLCQLDTMLCTQVCGA